MLDVVGRVDIMIDGGGGGGDGGGLVGIARSGSCVWFSGELLSVVTRQGLWDCAPPG